MNVFFDLDFTLQSADGGLRRGTHEVFGRLVEDGHQVYVWSGEGVRWREVRQHGLEPYLTGVYAKPLQDFDSGLRRLEVSAVPDFVIDDYPAIVRHFGGYHIPEFYSSTLDDDELESVYRVIREFRATGHADHPHWRPRTATSVDARPSRHGQL